jgi:Xaa-Pro dipeptidase
VERVPLPQSWAKPTAALRGWVGDIDDVPAADRAHGHIRSTGLPALRHNVPIDALRHTRMFPMSIEQAALLYRPPGQSCAGGPTKALARGGFDHLVVPSGTLHYQLFDDRDYPYAVNPQFKHWLPLTRTPDSWLVYTPGRRPQLIYCQPATTGTWCRPRRTAGGWSTSTSTSCARRRRPCRCCPPRRALRDPRRGAERARRVRAEQPRSRGAVPGIPALVQDALRAGADACRAAPAVRAHVAAQRAFLDGASEFDMHMAYCKAAGQDANELPYGNIVGFNEHAAVLHYTAMETAVPAQTRTMLIDAGASCCGYAADITRTYSYEGVDEFQALIDAVDKAQRGFAAGVRAGTDYRNLHLHAHHVLMGVLHEFGVLRVSPEAAVANGVSFAFLPHGWAIRSARRCTTWPVSPKATAAASSRARKAIRTCA